MADGWLQPYSRQIRDRQRLFDLKMKRIYFNLLNGFPKIFLKTITNRR